MIGLTVAAGWYFTWQLSTQVFEPIQAESLSFIRPLATTGELALGSGFAGLDQGVLIGAVLGAFPQPCCRANSGSPLSPNPAHLRSGAMPQARC
jgi:hypothetical protein